MILIISVFTLLSHADDIPTLIKAKAERHNIDPKLVYAIAIVESNLNPKAVGGVGEIGVFQLRPEFHDVKPGDVRHNIDTAVKYLVYVKRKCYTKYRDAWFICYNTGPHRKNIIKQPKKFIYYIKVIEQYKLVQI